MTDQDAHLPDLVPRPVSSLQPGDIVLWRGIYREIETVSSADGMTRLTFYADGQQPEDIFEDARLIQVGRSGRAGGRQQ